jgi:hypothetical protein
MRRVLTWLLLASAAASDAAPIDYARDILPILSDKCYHCHGPDEQARKAKLRLDTKEGAFRTKDPVIVPGKSSESELVARITTKNEDDVMPPLDSNRKLSAHQIELLTRWIDEGAKWGQHWAFTPPTRQAVPATPGTKSSILNPIDAFIAARLKKEGLAPAPEATRATWLRRVTLDLTGLPPTMKELDEFIADTSTSAHEKVVDRLLASPRFGERMASEWLDLARFADTHGYQMDRYRAAWAYRDWVIQAFNKNLPFDQFVTWQLAGDLLPNATKEQRLATAFNRLHNQNEEGGIVEEEFRVAYVVDRVNTFGTAFLGITTECARCHDHKYDPITQRDFYSLFAFFQNIDESGQTTYFTDSMPVPTLLLSTEAQDAKLAELKQQIEAGETELAVLHNSARADFTRWRKSVSSDQAQAFRDGLIASALTNALIGHFAFDEMISNRVANLAGTNSAKAQEGPKLVPGKFGQAVELNGENGFTFGKIGHFDRADPFTIALWLETPSHAPRLTVLHHSKAPIDAGSRGYELLLEEGRVAFGLHHMWPGNSLKVATRVRVPTNSWVHVAVTYDGSSRAGGVQIFINGVPSGLETIRDNLWKDITYEGGEPELTLGYRFRDNGFKGGRVDDIKVFGRALTLLEAAHLAGRKSIDIGDSNDRSGSWFEFFFAHHHAKARTRRDELHALRDEQRRFINPIPEIMAMQELPQPKPAYVLKRGAYDAPGERVAANTPAVLPPFPAGQPTNRLGLAQWLLQPDHPLFARVTVNRFWQMIFGRGLVETSDNFGSQGAQPTHPELLDWLALEFMQGSERAEGRGESRASPSDHTSLPWDIKRILRLIVTSATYRQSSRATPEALARDPHNDLLSHAPARRLTAEMLRDSALATSGLLVEKIGGPSVKPYQPEGIWDIAMGKPAYNQGKGDDLYRRSLYTFWKRTVPPPAMMIFDAADRSYCTARRQNTSTPLQALALLNDPQLVEAARFLSQRMWREGGTDDRSRSAWLFRTVAGRKPTAKEQSILLRLLAEQRELFTSDSKAAEKLLRVGAKAGEPGLDTIELAAGTVLANALLNHDEFVMRR